MLDKTNLLMLPLLIEITGIYFPSPFYQIVKLSNCQTVKLSNCQTGKLSNWQTVKLSNWQTVQLSNCQTVKLSNCQTFKLSNCQIVKLSNCQIVKLSNCQIIKLSNVKKIINPNASLKSSQLKSGSKVDIAFIHTHILLAFRRHLLVSGLFTCVSYSLRFGSTKTGSYLGIITILSALLLASLNLGLK